ncbi:MAG: hypothetical protein KBT02_13575 [Treponema sp.]|nr:hypothetical protein [Candidatus Treponema caballi]
MKRTCKMTIVLMLIASVFILASCDGLFTTSMMSGAARDPGKAAEALAKKPTKDLAADAKDAADMSSAQAVVGALSAQALQDPSVITSLKPEEKVDIINAAVTASIDKTALFDKDKVGFDLVGMMSGDENAVSDDVEPEDIIKAIIENTAECDTTCIVVILDDALTTDASGNAELDPNLDPELKANLTMGAIAVVASVIPEDVNMDDLMDSMEGDAADAGDMASDILGAEATPEKTAALTTALTVLSLLFADGSGIFGMGD